MLPLSHGSGLMTLAGSRLAAIILVLLCSGVSRAQSWPALPHRSATVEIPAQEWPRSPGARRVRIRVVYPAGKLSNVDSNTGVMLTLHNWGGEECAGTADPVALADRLNTVAVCVNYLQSGRQAALEDPEPYDFGYLQALDALRALWFVYHNLQERRVPFDAGRLYCTGGSGGGNVTQMAVKLAPRTFACVIDMCGMKKLSHDVAFNLPGGSRLNARWSRDPTSKNHLSVDHQELRFVGHPQHLSARKQMGTTTKIVLVHGVDDRVCPFEEARELTQGMRAAGLDVEPHFVSRDDLDGKVFTSSAHALGDRTEIVFDVAGKYLAMDQSTMIRRAGPTDFDRADEVRYRTSNGEFVISYQKGFPVGRFEPEPRPIAYPEHQDLGYFLDREHRRHSIQTWDDWNTRRTHILDNMQLVMGKLPAATFRPPLDVKYVDEAIIDGGKLRRRELSYQADPFDRVTAYLFLPREEKRQARNGLPAVLALHQTTSAGKDEPAGLAGRANMHYAIELARRGYVVLAPDYPSLGKHTYDFAANPEYVSGTMKAVWDNIRAVDLLHTLTDVDSDRIGVIGHSLGGHNAMFTAPFDPRIRVIVSSCGFTRFHKDDVPSWTGPRYMPRISSVYANRADQVPFDFTEIVASFAPRPFLAIAATDDRDFAADGVRDVVRSARIVYDLAGQPDNLQSHYPDSPHDFPPDARRRAYEFLDLHLRK